MHVNRLCVEIAERHVGSAGNREAADYFASALQSKNFRVEKPSFQCFDWHDYGSELTCGNKIFQVITGPYALGGLAKGPLAAVSSIAELENVESKGRIALVHGTLAAEQLMPKNFTFYNPEEHRTIIRLLESRGFAAVLAATSRNPGMVGGVYPFPLIEDGDFELPFAYMTDREGKILLDSCAGEMVSFAVRAERKPSRGWNVIATRDGKSDKRVVIMAHIDSKKGTPGAIDNASGATTLLLLAELLDNHSGQLEIELAAVNGEDYYSNPGEMLYLENNRGKFDNIILGINIDGAGYFKGRTAFSLYDCPREIEAAIRDAFSSENELVEGEPWYQGDHGLFLANSRPALAVTSTEMKDLLEIAHTEKDSPGLVDYKKLADVAMALEKLLKNIDVIA